MKKRLVSLTLTLALAAPLTSAGPAQAAGRFADVAEGAYYAQAVEWAVNQGITSGTSDTTFSPDQTCTTAQILTFLWRASRSPEPVESAAFSDIQPSDYYYKAALWAKEQGLVSGDLFRGNDPCTRSAVVAYLWKLQGSRGAAPSQFSDVPADADYAQAVNWAVEEGITSGTSDTAFSPDQICTRGQIATFLHRAIAFNPEDLQAMGGSYLCDRLQIKLVVDVQNNDSGTFFTYTLWSTEYDDMVQQATPGAGSINHLRDYGVDFYDDFVVLTGYNDLGYALEGVYIKEGHALPDWAKEQFADLISPKQETHAPIAGAAVNGSYLFDYIGSRKLTVQSDAKGLTYQIIDAETGASLLAGQAQWEESSAVHWLVEGQDVVDLEFYEDFAVVTIFSDQYEWLEAVYVKEGHTLPDWAKKQFDYEIRQSWRQASEHLR